MDSYNTTIMTLTMAMGIGVGGAFILTSYSGDPVPQYRVMSERQQGAPVQARPPLDCAQFRGTLAQGECEALNQHNALPVRERRIYDGATRILVYQQNQTGSVPSPSPEVAYALAQQMGVYQDAPLVYQAMQDNYKREMLFGQREQMISELQAPTSR
jgi:hypothetical protein